MTRRLTATEREALLSQWIQRSSDDEDEQQRRAERMVSQAVDRSSVAGSARVYAKGSYPNNTNVRRDSDVDIVIECHEVYFHDAASSSPSSTPQQRPRSGPWWPVAQWRSTVASLLRDQFGAGEVDTSHNVSFYIPAVAGSRPSIDVVPSFEYRSYGRRDATGGPTIGSTVWCKDGDPIINWPMQQLDNGRSKNNDTGHRYKYMVRALKNAENELARLGQTAEQPSYLMECLVYNVPDELLKRWATLDDTFHSTLKYLIEGTTSGAHVAWVEPNEIKPLFGAGQKWRVEDAHDLLVRTWCHLNYE